MKNGMRQELGMFLMLLLVGLSTFSPSILQAKASPFFEDGFESNSFSAWSGTIVTAGETASVVNTRPYLGDYGARYTSNGGGGYENAYCLRTITASEIYIQGYFYVSQSGIDADNDRFFFLVLRASNSSGLAYAGWKRMAGSVYWCITMREGSNYVDFFSGLSPSTGRWYCVELHWKKDSSAGYYDLWVDGFLACSPPSRDTDDFGDVGLVQVGLAELYGCAPTTVYADSIEAASSYIGPVSTPGADWVVDDDGPADRSTIQEAVDAASSGDTILVKRGIYYEHVTTRKSLNLLGESMESIVDGSGTEDRIIWYFVSEGDIRNCRISGFTIRNGGTGISLAGGGDGGIYNVTVSDNTIQDCNIGVAGPWRTGSDGLVITDNLLVSNGQGVGLEYSGDVLVEDNVFRDNGIGIRVYGCEPTISGNLIELGTTGIQLEADEKGQSLYNITDNRIIDNDRGIFFTNDNDGWGEGTVFGNTIQGNNYGVYIMYDEVSQICTLHHNSFVDNTIHVYRSGMGQGDQFVWDNSYPSGGNYWSDYSEPDQYSGPRQNVPGPDGFGDNPYTVLQGSVDNYPLIRPVGESTSVPVATFILSPASPLVDQTVTLDASTSYDLDGSIVSYKWSFGDGATATKTIPTTTHVYTETGTYTIGLTVTDNTAKTDTGTRIITVVSTPATTSTLSISASPNPTTTRDGTQIRGALTPAKPSTDITISYRKTGSQAWIILATVKTGSDSWYSFTWFPTEVADYELRAKWSGDSTTLPAQTPVITIYCQRIQTSISIRTSSSSALVGLNVEVSGRLADSNGDALIDENILLSYTFRGIQNWVPVTSDTTDGAGDYSVTWIPSATGYYVIKAEWSGNSTHSATSSTTTLSSISYMSQVFSVESNSSTSQLSFNETDRSLSFSIEGPTGTNGYARITVAKNMVNDASNVRIILDGVEKSFAMSSLDDSWLLAFDYSHSTHQVVVDLDITIVPEFPGLAIIPLVMMATLLVTMLPRKRT